MRMYRKKRKCDKQTADADNTKSNKQKLYMWEYRKKRKCNEETKDVDNAKMEKKNLYTREYRKKRKCNDETKDEDNAKREKKNLYMKEYRNKIRNKSENNYQTKTNENKLMHTISEKQTFLSANGHIHHQPWAVNNMVKFHKSMKYKIHQCQICHKAWPIKATTKKENPSLYVCLRCVRDKNNVKKFSIENNMIPSCVPKELQELTQIEEMLIARAFPVISVYTKPGGQRA